MRSFSGLGHSFSIAGQSILEGTGIDNNTFDMAGFTETLETIGIFKRVQDYVYSLGCNGFELLDELTFNQPVAVFLCYSNGERDLAETIYHNLNQLGLSMFMAPADITPGLGWPEILKAAIESSEFFIPIITNRSDGTQILQSFANAPGANQETGIAIALSNKISWIPLLFDDVSNPPGLPTTRQGIPCQRDDLDNVCFEIFIQII